MKNKITIFIFLILIISGVYALSGAYNTDMGGNIMGYITDTGAPRFSIYDLSQTSPEDDWYNRNVAAKGFGAPRVAVCDNVTQYCREYTNGTEIPTPIRKQEIVAPPVNYFSQNCIDQGFIAVTGFPFTYKCSEDKTGFYICYKRGSGIYIEPNMHPFSGLGSNTRNRLKNAICLPDPVQNENTDPILGNTTLVENPDVGSSSPQNITPTIISDAEMIPSLIEEISYIGFNSENSEDIGPYGHMPTPKTKNIIPKFIINYEEIGNYQTYDTNVTVYLDSQDFNFDSEIYAIIAPKERYGDLLTEVNNFIKTENSEYSNTQEYSGLLSRSTYSVYCYCKQKSNSTSSYEFPVEWRYTNISGDPNSIENKLTINNFCRRECITNKAGISSTNNSKIYEYDDDNYDLELTFPYEVINNYKLTKIQTIDKIKFMPNGNTFQFTIERNNPNKKFVMVFLQKDNKRLNISYSNFYVLNNDEIIKYSQCESNRIILSFFCNKYMTSSCGVIKSCFNEYDLNFNAIDLTEYVYSARTGTTIVPSGSQPNIITVVEPGTSTELDNDSLNEEIKYYSTRNLTRDACTNANITLNNWACVCSISSTGVKRAIAAKCTASNGLVLYGVPQKAQVPVTYQFCYSEPSTKCR